MNTLDTLVFPDTILPAYRQFPLALFFNSLHLLQPVERDETDNRDRSPAADSYPFMETGFCQVHTPSRLGTDRERFLHLVNDIRDRKDNYVEQLSYLSLASLSEQTGHGDPSKQTIISSLLDGMDRNDAPSDEQERLALWQARLVLSIAEILDREEEELARQLAAIDDREIALFRSLQGEIAESGEENGPAEDPFQELLELRQKLNQPRPGMIKNRLRAWSRLYLSGPLPEPALWTTCRQEAADILLEQYEQECGQAPLPLLQLELPARFHGDPGREAELVQQFRAGMQPHLHALAEALDRLAKSEIAAPDAPALLLPQAEEWRNAWNTKLEAVFPAGQYGRMTLHLSLLAGMPLPALINESHVPAATSVQNGLLVVLT